MSVILTGHPEAMTTAGWVLDALVAGAVAFDADLRVRAWNRTMVRWTGVVAERALGRELTALIPTLSQPRYALRIEDVLRGGPSTTFDSLVHEGLLGTIDGRPGERRVRCQVSTWYDWSSRQRVGMLVFEDCTILHQLESESRRAQDRALDDLAEARRVERTLRHQVDHLGAANDELQQFAYMASHDLREPLHKVRMFARLLEEDVEGLPDGEALDMVRSIGRATERLEGLLGDSLALLRSGENTEAPRPVDCAAIVADALDDLESRIDEADAVVEVGEIPLVFADPVSIHHLVLNLLSNALKFRHPERRCRVTVEAAHGSVLTVDGELDAVRLIVRDNGIGFDPRYASEIFKPFRRLHGRSDSYGGHGLGLSICRRIVRRLGGQIWAESRNGGGAAFHVVLPAAYDEAAETSVPAADPMLVTAGV